MYIEDENKNDAIAIVGMAVSVTGADTLDEFWTIVENGVEAISATNNNGNAGKRNGFIRVNSFINRRKEFDTSFFGISGEDAKLMDPQQRRFLECSWEAMENAGYVPKKYKGLIGLYVGAYANTYLFNNVFPSISGNGFVDNMEILMSNEKDHIATRTAYTLGFTGPVVNVQSSCSSSLLAVHLACQGLMDYSCDMAVAGAATVGASDEDGYLFKDVGILSKDGHVRPFDAEATGTIYSEGVGAVVLKRLEDAINDNDHIYAIIRGSAVNNDGSERVGYTAPSVKGQVQVIRRAQANSDVDRESITYIETHGTGTPLGDKIELEALHQAFRDCNDKGFCAIGSVKANIGHAGPASGVIGLIKTAMAIEKRIIPPSINYVNENSAIDIFESPFYVNVIPQKWETTSGVIRAGVSSFGLGGTNVHMILENPIKQIDEEEKDNKKLFVLSAKSEGSLINLIKEYTVFLANHSDVSKQNMSYTLMSGRESFRYRYSCLFDSVEELEKKLNSDDLEICDSVSTLPVVLMVTTDFSSDDIPLKELLAEDPLFKTAYYSVKQIAEEVCSDENATHKISIAYAIGKTLLDMGVCFDRIIGKSCDSIISDGIKGNISIVDMVKAYISGIVCETEDDNGCGYSDNTICVFYHRMCNTDGVLYCFDETGSIDTFYAVLSKLWSLGALKDWNSFLSGKKGERIPLPTYQFERTEYWIEPVAYAAKKQERKERCYNIRNEEQMIGFVEPLGFLEKKIAEIWEDELGIKPVGAADGFFQLGGSSLKAAKVNEIINDFFGTDLSLRDFLENQTIGELKNRILTL